MLLIFCQPRNAPKATDGIAPSVSGQYADGCSKKIMVCAIIQHSLNLKATVYAGEYLTTVGSLLPGLTQADNVA